MALSRLLDLGSVGIHQALLEYSATPLLDVQADPTLSYSFEGLYSIAVQGFQHQDSKQNAPGWIQFRPDPTRSRPRRG